MGATRDLLEASITTWNRHDRNGWSSTFASTAQLSGPGGIQGSGPEMVGMFYSLWQEAFPDNQVRTINLAEDGPTGIIEAVFEGTHTAPMNAPTGSIPATGKRVSIPFVAMQTVGGGKFTRFALYFDQVELMTQLGLMPSPAAASA